MSFLALYGILYTIAVACSIWFGRTVERAVENPMSGLSAYAAMLALFSAVYLAIGIFIASAMGTVSAPTGAWLHAGGALAVSCIVMLIIRHYAPATVTRESSS